MRNSRNENLSEHLLNIDEEILGRAYEIDDAEKLRQYTKLKTQKNGKPFCLTPMFRRVVAMAACFAIILTVALLSPNLINPPEWDFLMLENGGNFNDNIGGNGTTDIGGNGTTNVGGNGTTDVGGNGTTDVGGNGTTDVGGNGTTDIGGNGTTDVGGNGTSNVGGNGTTDVGGNGTTDVGGNGTTDIGGNGTTDVGGNGTTDIGGNGTTNVGGNEMVRTVLDGGGLGGPSLPYYVSTEIVKRCLISDGTVSAKIFLGHDRWFSDLVYFTELDRPLSIEELKDCTFSLVAYYNSGTNYVEIANNIDYSSELYDVTIQDQWVGEDYNGYVVNYSKFVDVDFDISSMVGVSYGYVIIGLRITLPDGSQAGVMSDSVYYSVTDTEIVFGLVSNPIAHEGDEGIITHGWTYAG